MKKTSVILVSILAIALSACADRPTVLSQVKQQGELVVVTRNSPTTYYEGPMGPTGLEYNLANMFADYLDVELKLVKPTSFNEILPMVAGRNAHFAAAGLTITEARKNRVRFGPSYQQITQQLVYRTGTRKPKHVDDLIGGELEVIAGSSHAEQLKKLLLSTPKLDWHENPEVESEELLSMVWGGKIDYTIADSNELALNQRFYPELRVAFDISEPEQIAWAFPRGGDDSLYKEAVKFFASIKESGQLAQLLERHYGHVKNFDYVGTRKFMRHIDQRLSQYQSIFEEESLKNNLDWKLLAAIGYQESHWNPKAISPTGVRGIMMLTRITAADMGFENRVDPINSIKGGARYFKLLKNKIPDAIQEPDRTWFALAAYNIGLGHVKDAQKITRQLGSDPSKWMDVKERLPLLMQKRWHSQTKHGYARGKEAVRYVENIRSYYDILAWQTETRKEDLAITPVQYPIASNQAIFRPYYR